ncbi:MAG: serine hydrolase [Porphyromonadaceae bacterium]|nr:MAG: serine hydrolase [Porphyromonadaceae bacterium]
MKNLIGSVLLSSLLTAAPISVISQAITPAGIDQLVESTLKAFNVPGIAIAIIKDGQMVFAKGYGVRSLETNKPVDEHTLFGIASNTKAFTATALGILIDERKLNWDDKVIDYIPEFRLYNPYVTQDFTIRDLLTHRSGMGLGAGDLMIWPDGSDFTRSDIIHNLRYLKQVSPFRAKYDYDNNLYIIAGELIARVSGLSWEEFVQQRILKPLEMKETATSFVRLKDTSNVIAAHAMVNGTVQVIERTKGELMNAAGGIYSSIHDLSKWVIMHMNKGSYGPESKTQLISKRNQKELWTPQTLMGVVTAPPYNSHFATYGLGFRLSDVKGYLEVSHTGGLAGMVTQITMYPELNLGIIVLTNQQVGAAFSAITNQIKDSYLGILGMDWVKILSESGKKSEDDAARVTNKVWADIAKQQASGSGTKTDPALYTGTYRDPWFGDITIEQKDGCLWFRAKRSPGLTGELIYYQGQTFIAKWNDRSMDADAFVLFQTGYDGKASGIKMKPISPLTDFSYDFQDLEFERVKELK